MANSNGKPKRIGEDLFGGLLGKAEKALRGKAVPNGQKGKKKKTRQEILDSI